MNKKKCPDDRANGCLGAKATKAGKTFITDNTPARARRQIKNLITACAVRGIIPIGPACWLTDRLKVER